MSNFLNITPKNSVGIDLLIYSNALKLKKDAILIADKNKSYSTATSLLVLSSEEIIKAFLILLHSENYNVYSIDNAKKFFSDHKIRHDLAKIIEVTVTLFDTGISFLSTEDNGNKGNILSKFTYWIDLFATALQPIKSSVKRFNKLEEFNNLKNQGLYVDYRSKLLIPKDIVGENDYLQVRDIVERIFRVYKLLRILFNPNLKQRVAQKDIEEFKNNLQIVLATICK